MKVRFVMYGNECLIVSNHVTVKQIEEMTDPETQEKSYLMEADCKTPLDVGIKCPDGVIRRPSATVAKGEYSYAVGWKENFF